MNNERKKMKKGINLIVLVITIIVLIILVAAIMFMFSGNNPINEAKKARFVMDVSSFKDELELYKAQQYATTGGTFSPESLNADTDEEVVAIIKSLGNKDEYEGKFQIVDGGLCLKGGDKDENKWGTDVPGLLVVAKPDLTLVTATDVPVKSGTNVDYYMDISSGVEITDVILNGNIKVVNESGTELSTQPSITLGTITGTENSKEATITINTTGIADGKYKLKVLAGAVKNIGYDSVETISNNIFELDSTAPQMPSFEMTPSVLPSWMNSNITVGITKDNADDELFYSLDGVTYQKYTMNLTITANTKIYAKLIDKAQNVSNIAILDITNIDKVSPVVTFGTNGGSNMSQASTVTTVTDTNGSGINTAQYIWSTSTTEPSSGWTAFTSGSTLTYAQNGTYYLWVKTADKAGNITTARSNVFSLDITPPTAASMETSSTAWTNGNVTVTITYSADSVTKQYSTDGTNWSTYSTSVVVGTNNTTVYARGYDASGNISTISTKTITNIDKTAPTVAFSPNGGNGTSISTTSTVNDVGGSGLNTSTLQYAWSNNTTEPSSGWVAFTNGTALSKSVDGTYYLWIKATDTAGNSSTNRSNVFTVSSDVTPPTAPTISSSPTTWTAGTVSVTITYSGDSTTRQYSTNGTTWNEYTAPIAVSTNSTTIYARAYDAAGNMSTSSTKTISNIDKTVPQNASLSAYSTTGTLNCSITMSDSQSGINAGASRYIATTQSTTYATDSTIWNSANALSSTSQTVSVSLSNGTYYLHVLSVDNAGNKTANVSNGVNIINGVSRSTTMYFSDYSQSQSQSTTLPNLISVSSVSTNNGGVGYSTSGNTIYVNVYSGSGSSGSSSSSQYATTTQGPQSTNSFPSTKYYTSGSYSGNLSYQNVTINTVSTPTYTYPTKTLTNWVNYQHGSLYNPGAGYPWSYDDGTYRGTIYFTGNWSSQSGIAGDGKTVIHYALYSGTVTKKVADVTYTNTYNYTGNYAGYIYSTSYYTYYPYTVTIYYLASS